MISLIRTLPVALAPARVGAFLVGTLKPLARLQCFASGALIYLEHSPCGFPRPRPRLPLGRGSLRARSLTLGLLATALLGGKFSLSPAELRDTLLLLDSP